MGGGQPSRPGQRFGPAIRHRFAQRVQVFADGLGKHGFHARAVGTVTQQRQPLVTLAQHVGNGVLGRLHVHVQMLQQHAHGVVLVGQIKRGARRGFVVCAGVIGDLGHAAQFRQPRHAAHQPRAEGIDGADGQARRVIQQMPALRFVARQRGTGQLPAAAFVHGLGRPVQPAAQLAQHAGVHFGRGLAREGDGDDLFRTVHRGQQGQDAVGQQFGLARPGGGLHQKRTGGVQRVGARGVVLRQAFLFSHAHASSSSRCKRRNGNASQYFKSSRR
ncbi:hypothetical protein ACMA110817_23575 [Achromobacter marplatensis]